MPNPGLTRSPSTKLQEVAERLRLGGWISFWIQFVVTIAALIMLGVSIFGNVVAEDAHNPITGFSIFLSACGTFALAFNSFLSFRYTHLARRLRHPDPARHPQRGDTFRSIQIGLIVSLVGTGITLLGAQMGIGILLAKLLTQPQGVAIYNPEQIIRVLDIVVVLSNSTLAIAHFIASLTYFWLLQRLP